MFQASKSVNGEYIREDVYINTGKSHASLTRGKLSPH